MNVPLAGGTVGALKTERESIYVAVVVVEVIEVTVLMVVVVVTDVIVLVVAVVEVVLVAICMLNVAVANRAATDASPAGNTYM